MAQAANIWRDPNVEIGPYRILARTTGGFVLYDERLPAAARSAGWAPTLDAAKDLANELVVAGSPLQSEDETRDGKHLRASGDSTNSSGARRIAAPEIS